MKTLALAALGIIGFVLTNLHLRRVIKMATKDQEQRLQAGLQEVRENIGEIKTGVTRIQEQNTKVLEELETLKADNPDLEDEIQSVTDLASETQAMADSLAAKVPEIPGETGGGGGGESGGGNSETGTGGGDVHESPEAGTGESSQSVD